jgi:hypothetical protein
MDEQNLERWEKLVERFKPGLPEVLPWDARRLEARYSGASHGQKCIIQFLLNVWNPDAEWACGRFDVIEAIRIWDERYREVFLAWAAVPWWP